MKSSRRAVVDICADIGATFAFCFRQGCPDGDEFLQISDGVHALTVFVADGFFHLLPVHDEHEFDIGHREEVLHALDQGQREFGFATVEFVDDEDEGVFFVAQFAQRFLEVFEALAPSKAVSSTIPAVKALMPIRSPALPITFMAATALVLYFSWVVSSFLSMRLYIWLEMARNGSCW